MLVTLIGRGFCLSIFDHDSASSSIREHLHNHTTLIHNSSNTALVNPEMKTAAKAATCATIGKGVCLGVTAAKYADKKLIESNNQIK